MCVEGSHMFHLAAFTNLLSAATPSYQVNKTMKVTSVITAALFLEFAQGVKITSHVRRVADNSSSAGEGNGLDGETECGWRPILFFNDEIEEAVYSSLTNYGVIDLKFYSGSSPLGFFSFDATIQGQRASPRGLRDCLVQGHIGFFPGPPFVNTLTFSFSCDSFLGTITGGTGSEFGSFGELSNLFPLENGRQSMAMLYVCRNVPLGVDAPLLFQQPPLDFSGEGLAAYANAGALGDFLSRFSSVEEIIKNGTDFGTTWGALLEKP